MKENIYYLNKWWLMSVEIQTPRKKLLKFESNNFEKYTSKITATSPKA